MKDNNLNEIRIVLPERSEDSISESLRELTRQICLKTNDSGSGGLGGEYGYGSNFENDVFMMHRYCWCESEDCPWCGEEYAPNFLYKPTDASIHWYKYIGRGQELDGEIPNNWFEKCLESMWEKDDCWIEFNKNFDKNDSIILCFSPFDKEAIIEIFLSEFNPMDVVYCWDANTFFNTLIEIEYDENKYNRVKKLRKKYPQMDKKINKLALKHNQEMIDWHQKRIDIVLDKR